MDKLLLKASQVGRILNLGTRTVVNRARAGRIPGALIVGAYAYFRPDVIHPWVAAGCPLRELEKPPVFTIVHHGAREHAGGRPRNDARGRPEGQIERTIKVLTLLRRVAEVQARLETNQ